MSEQDVFGKAKKGGAGAWIRVGSLANRMKIAAKDRQERQTRTGDEAALELQHRQEALLCFYTKYEELVELLCDGAQYGPNGQLAARYQTLRKWMQEHYPAMRPYVVAYLQYDAADARESFDLHGISGDAFETLFAALDLDDLLRKDDGSMISRIMRTRQALNLYADHLRRLEKCG
jgi:hypothetical protein